MIQSKRLVYNERKLSDLALDGLFGGLAGGVAMAIYLVIWGIVDRRGAVAVLGMFDPAMRGVAMTGALTHLAVSAVYGLLFGLIWWVAARLRRGLVPAWLFGALYGLALLALAKSIVLPAAGSPLAEIPTLHFAIGHVIYGALLGFVAESIGARAV